MEETHRNLKTNKKQANNSGKNKRSNLSVCYMPCFSETVYFWGSADQAFCSINSKAAAIQIVVFAVVVLQQLKDLPLTLTER